MRRALAVATDDYHLPTEAALLERARGGDREALGALLGAYQDRVFSLIRRWVFRDDHAAELTQETFVRAFTSIGRFELGRPFRPWLFKIAIHVCKNYGRAAARRERSCRRLADPR